MLSSPKNKFGSSPHNYILVPVCLTLSFFSIAWRTFKVKNMLSLGLINGTVWRDCRNTGTKLRVTVLMLKIILSMYLVHGLENSLNAVRAFSNKLGTKADITDVYYKNELYTKTESGDRYYTKNKLKR